MQYPGKYHFKLLRHLLRHIQCHRNRGGNKNVAQSPLHYMSRSGNETHTNSPIICFTDSSFQDCPDTARSTGGFLIFMQGVVIDVTSTMLTVISQSTCEAEYCTCALATVASHYVKKIYNEFYCHDPDYQIKIPIGIDSQSAIDTANSFRETQRTKHIARRFHFVLFAIGSSQITLFKVDGEN
jgi:hypothetical protein